MAYNLKSYMLRMHQLDTRMCLAFNHTSEYRIVRHFFRLISRLGDGVFWYSIMLLMLINGGLSAGKPVLHMAIAGLTGTLVYKWLKGKTLRPRPYEVRQDIQLTGTALDKFSFPSGHTLHAVVFAFVGVSYYPTLIILLLPFTLLVAISRVVLGLHYPSDVLAGAMLGLFIGEISFSVIELFQI